MRKQINKTRQRTLAGQMALWAALVLAIAAVPTRAQDTKQQPTAEAKAKAPATSIRIT